MAVVAVQCPECGGTEVVRYGRQANGEQRYRCNNVDCERRGGVLTLDNAGSHRQTKFIAINEQTNHDIVQLGGFGEADRFAH